MTKTKLLSSVLIASSALSLTIALPAAAQNDGDEEQAVMKTVTVTAQKREQSLQDVGIAISVADQEVIESKRIETAADLIQFTPNANVKELTPGLMPVVTIRGIGLNDFSSTNNPATGVYIDEIALSSLALLSGDLFDLERMEVLKGPQGTLYGRNSTAGALNIISAKPDFDGFSGRVKAGIGNFNFREVEGFANIPLSDSLAIRASGKAVIQDEGFYDNAALGRDIGRRDVLLGRLQAAWDINEDISVLLKAEGQQGRSELGGPEFFGALPTGSESSCPGQPGCSNFFGYADTDDDPFTGSFSTDPAYDLDQVMLTSRIDVDLGFADLTSVTGYINFSRSYSADVDASLLRLTDFSNSDDVNQVSQEVRLSGSTDLADWQVGVFYAVDNVKTTYDGSLQDLFNTTTFTFADQEASSAAIFANAEWNLSDALSLITGLRYTDETRENLGFTQDNVSGVGGSFLTMAPFGFGPITLASVDDEINNSSWSWKLGLNWKPSEDHLIYASVSESDKSGGFFTGVATSNAQLIPYEPETLRSYEIGAKGQYPSAGLRYEASVFYYDYNDVQTFIQDTVGSIPVQRLGNVEEAEIYGADVSVTYAPREIEGLDLNAGIGLLSTELGEFAASAGTIPAGNKLPDASDVNLILGATYEGDLTNSLSFRIGLDGRYKSDAFLSALNDPLLESGSYWVNNAQVSLIGESNWEASLWIKNLSDKEYVTQGLDQLIFGNGYRVYGAPQTYGVTLSKAF